MKTIKAWAVLEEGTLTGWSTSVNARIEDNVWQYPIFFTRKEARSFKEHKGIGSLKIVPCTITYEI